MVKQIILPIAAVCAFIILVGLMFKNPEKFNFSKKQSSVFINDKKVDVSLADNDEKRAKGLGGVSLLGKDSGMLFVFSTKDVKPVFWMKDMIIPIDIIWINDDKIVQIDKNIKAPQPKTPDNKIERFTPQGVIDYVLEVNAGFSDTNNIKVGDPVRITF